MTTDAELLRTCAEGDPAQRDEAFRMLIDRYIGLVYGACWRQLHDRHLVEDALQGVFILLSQKAGTVRPEHLAGWLLTAARYACANMRKTQLRRERRETAAAMEKSSPENHERAEMLSLLDEGLCQLRPDDREAVVLRYLEERPLRAVGEAIGVSEEAARKRVDRGLEKLRRFFAQRGVQTTGVALGTVLGEQSVSLTTMAGAATGGAILTAAMRDAMTQGILNACQPGVASSAPALAAAKGIKIMMLTAKLKMAAAVLAVVGALGMGAWGISAALAQRAAAPATNTPTAAGAATPAATAPAATPAATANAAGLVMDLSAPEKTLESLCKALQAGDRANTYLCLSVHPDGVRTKLDLFLNLSLGQNHLIRAAKEKFGGDGEYARHFVTLDKGLNMLAMATQAMGQPAKIDGDKATLTLVLPEAILKATKDGPLADAGIQAMLRQWSGKAVHFAKDGAKWKVTGDNTLSVVISLWGKNNQAITDEAKQEAAAKDLGDMYDTLAGEIEKEKFPGWEEAGAQCNVRTRAIMDKYEAMWLDWGVVPVEDAPPKH